MIHAVTLLARSVAPRQVDLRRRDGHRAEVGGPPYHVARCATVGSSSPVGRVVSIAGCIDPHQRSATAGSFRGPGRRVVVFDAIDQNLGNAQIGLNVAGHLQTQALATVVERAGERTNDLHPARNTRPAAKRRRILPHDQHQAAGRKRESGGKLIGDAVEAPSVGRLKRIEQRHVFVRDVLQLDKLYALAAGVVHDFRNHNRSDQWVGVGRAKCCVLQRNEILSTVRLDVSPQRAAIRAGIEILAGAKAKDLLALDRLHDYVIAQFAQRERRAEVLSLRKGHESKGRDDRFGGNLVLQRRVLIIAQVPAADVNCRIGRVQQFDPITGGRVAVGQHLVDDHRTRRGHVGPVGRARRSVDVTAGPPGGFVV